MSIYLLYFLPLSFLLYIQIYKYRHGHQYTLKDIIIQSGLILTPIVNWIVALITVMEWFEAKDTTPVIFNRDK